MYRCRHCDNNKHWEWDCPVQKEKQEKRLNTVANTAIVVIILVVLLAGTFLATTLI